MTNSSDTPRKRSAASRLDIPSPAVPSIDQPWEAEPEDRAHRLGRRPGDRSEHRKFHGLFDDLLN